MSEWKDRIVGERMQVDNEFQDRVEASSFSRQQWGLVMTAVDFDIENPGDAEDAKLVADTSSLQHVMGEMENIETQMQHASGGGGRSQSSGGFLSGVKSAIGHLLGGSDDEENHEELEVEAAELAQEYADALQAKLEENGRWDEVRKAA